MSTSTSTSYQRYCPMCCYVYDTRKVHTCNTSSNRNFISELHQQIIEAENVIREYRLMVHYDLEIHKAYLEKWK